MKKLLNNMTSMKKTAVIMKTHVWSDDIEIFAKKLYHETKLAKVEFFVLMHDESGELIDQISDEKIKEITLTFKESDIFSLYSSGYQTIWLSNHWILMWFYLNHEKKYHYIWSIEYDVRICGYSYPLWLSKDDSDFIYPQGNHRNPNGKYIDCYTGDQLSETERFSGFLQIARYSKDALKYLHNAFSKGENGQDEMIIFSLMNRSKLKMSNRLLKPLVSGRWTWEGRYVEYNRKVYNNYCTLCKHDDLFIFHPIK